MPKTKSHVRNNESLRMLRSLADSTSAALKFALPSHDWEGGESLVRAPGMYMGMLKGINPETGDLEDSLLYNLKNIWKGDRRRMTPGFVEEFLGSPHDIATMFGGEGPQWSRDASARADRIRNRTWDSLGIEAPDRMKDVAQDSAAMMALQPFYPAKRGAAGVEMALDEGNRLWRALKGVGSSAAEWFSPITKGTPETYGHGVAFPTAMSGVMSGLMDSVSPLIQLGQSANDTMSSDASTLDPRIAGPSRRYWEAENRRLEKELEEEEQLEQRRQFTENLESPTPGYGKAGIVKPKQLTGALEQAMKSVSINPDATKNFKGYPIGDPKEEILYSTNEAVRRGLITPMHKEVIMRQMAAGDEQALINSLMKLHEKLFPTPVAPSVPAPTPIAPALAPMGHGQLTQEEWEKKVLGKAKGGVPRMDKLLELFSRDYKTLTPKEKKQFHALHRAESKARGISPIDLQREIDDIHTQRENERLNREYPELMKNYGQPLPADPLPEPEGPSLESLKRKLERVRRLVSGEDEPTFHRKGGKVRRLGE